MRISLVSMALGAGVGMVVARRMSKRNQSESSEHGQENSRGIEHLIRQSLQEERI